MNDDLVKLLYTIANLAIVPLTGILAALGTMAVQKIKLYGMNIKGTKLEQIKLNATISVQSSQQRYRAKMITNKKDAAIETMKKLCKEQKLDVPDSIISELIESSVWEDINSPAVSIPVPTVTNILSSPIVPTSTTSTEVVLDDTPLG
jgi:hypothetical protein